MAKIWQGKSSESVQCAITGPCLRMRHRPSALHTVPIRKICQYDLKTLETSLARKVLKIFRYHKPFRRGSRVGWTNGRTGGH